MTLTLAPIAARAADRIDDAARALVAAQQVDWVSDAADRYRAALTEGQQAVLRAAALVATARQTLLASDAAESQAAADSLSGLGQRVHGGAR